ncbi:MAG: kinase [Planctomycetota bacterium]|nr:kinase [Planctomycetota bacterium]
MSRVQTTAKDGSPVEFVYQDPMQGGMKDVYFSPDKRDVVAFFRKKLDARGVERLEKLVGPYRQGIFEQTGGEYWKKLFCWPQKIVEYQGKTGIVVPAYQQHFFFGKNTALAGAEKEGKWFASAKNFNRFVPPPEKGDLVGYLRICLQIARAVRRLHAAGLAHSDLSYKNCLVDPAGGNACIIDIDGLVVPGLFPPDVVGTPDFIAPEVNQTLSLKRDDPNRKLPSRATDLHALAVLIYMYLFHRHPLRGGKTHDQDPQKDELLTMGEKALFIEHPADQTNRVKLDKNGSDKVCLPWVDPEQLPYTMFGPTLKTLFEKAFIDGLHQPRLRPSADDWEDALVKTMDMIQPCQNAACVKKWFVFANTTKPKCPYCGTAYRGVLPVLDFYSSRNGADFKPDNHRLMVFSGQSLYQWHADRAIFPNEKLTAAQTKRVGYFSFYKDKWMFVNETLTGLKNLSTGAPIPVGRGVDLTEGLQLLLSPAATGRIVNVKIVKG